ncbi:helix-turn-helix domain-containing protein [Candidatus Peregrinibacteria bacterium]|nr:helix-turn-helix domain-containing protein [Candidatus Peregrinibacteria bacterium]
MEDQLLDLQDVARQLNISYNHLVNNLIKSDKIPVINVGSGNQRTLRVSKEDLKKYLDEQSSKQTTIQNAAENVQNLRDSLLLSYIAKENAQLTPDDALMVSDVLNDLKKKKGIEGKIPKLDLFINSFGGALEAAYKIVQICRDYANEIHAIVPVYAKSAATAIVLGCDSLTISKVGELGPIDPIIIDQNTGKRFPVKSIEALFRFRSDEEKLKKFGIDPKKVDEMIGKMDPFTLGAYLNTRLVSEEYIPELLKKGLNKNDTDENVQKITDYFINELHSHAHPITFTSLCEKGVKNCELLEGQLEEGVKQLLRVYMAYMNTNSFNKIIGNAYWQFNNRAIQITMQKKEN